MRLLIRLIIVLALIWCGWWALASWGVSRGVDAWVEARKDEGWQADVQTAQRGFPLNIATRIRALDLRNPITATGIAAQGGALKARTYWPGHIDLDLPGTPITLRGPLADSNITAQDARASLRLRPGLSLELARVGVRSGAWSVKSADLESFSGATLTLRADQAGRGSATYDLQLNVDDMALSAQMRELTNLPAALPETFETFAAKGTVTFDAALSGSGTEGAPPQFRQITLQSAQIIWGTVRLSALGAIDVDAAGIPSGSFQFQAKDWRNLLDLAQATGAVQPDVRGQAEFMARLIANRGGSPDDIDLELRFEDGQMFVSDLPFGPAPRLLLQ